ncbi:MAG: tRNA 2-thiouridine(34) synthase MnmA [Elusimicrobia bacterium]|nr:tRNA 2-thiouridine(34) synthase MnmA [Elusimicrobiota bacterium]
MAAKAVVAMSGGVDSSVAAAVMAREGFETVGVTLKLLGRAETGFGCCGSPADIEDAKRVCEQIGIPHYTLDMAQLFEDAVVRPFIDSYLHARTPNPCVECNRSVKFGALLGLAEAWGAQILATGHYARVFEGKLYRAADRDKDQSYFLYSLGPRELSRVRFPLGELSKAQVRVLARALGLKTADKPESQEICFVPRKDYRSFLTARAPEGTVAAFTPGPIRDSAGRALGSHRGLASYTVGQRKGLGLAGGEPLYVLDIDAPTNTLVVGRDEEARFSSFVAGGLSWTAGAPSHGRGFLARIRHRHEPAPASIESLSEKEVLIRLEQPQRAVTPGQAAVFYRGDEVIGGGTILKSHRHSEA